jgi:hypothetical protein
MKQKIISLALLLCLLTQPALAMSRDDADAVTSTHAHYADYLAQRKIIAYHENLDNYKFNSGLLRHEVIGMALAMAGIVRNPTCR